MIKKNQSDVLSEYICAIADGSYRPESTSCMASAAMSCLSVALGKHSPMNNSDIRNLISRLVKTQKKNSNSKPIPIQPFRILFSDLGENNTLFIRQLRLKAIVLLACMTRPSD